MRPSGYSHRRRGPEAQTDALTVVVLNILRRAERERLLGLSTVERHLGRHAAVVDVRDPAQVGLLQRYHHRPLRVSAQLHRDRRRRSLIDVVRSLFEADYHFGVIIPDGHTDIRSVQSVVVATTGLVPYGDLRLVGRVAVVRGRKRYGLRFVPVGRSKGEFGRSRRHAAGAGHGHRRRGGRLRVEHHRVGVASPLSQSEFVPGDGYAAGVAVADADRHAVQGQSGVVSSARCVGEHDALAHRIEVANESDLDSLRNVPCGRGEG